MSISQFLFISVVSYLLVDLKMQPPFCMSALNSSTSTIANSLSWDSWIHSSSWFSFHLIRCSCTTRCFLIFLKTQSFSCFWPFLIHSSSLSPFHPIKYSRMTRLEFFFCGWIFCFLFLNVKIIFFTHNDKDDGVMGFLVCDAEMVDVLFVWSMINDQCSYVIYWVPVLRI